MSINVSIVYNTIISRILLWLSDIAVILIIGVTTVVGHNARLEYYTEPLTSSPGSLGPATNGRTVRGETDQWEASDIAIYPGGLFQQQEMLGSSSLVVARVEGF